MKAILSILVLLLFSLSLFADSYTFQSDGDWTDQSNWDSYPGSSIASSDTVIIDALLILDAGVTIHGYIKINETASFTNEWLLTVHGQLTVDGEFINDSQLNLFGICDNNGDWTTTPDGSLIVANNGDYTNYGNLINNGSILGYNSGHIKIKGHFENNDHMTINSIFDIKLDEGVIYTNNGFSQFNGTLRLEGDFVNTVNGELKINHSATLFLADFSELNNNGEVKILGECQLSSQMLDGTTLGDFEVKGNLLVKESIPEIL